jgi:hypothetical protein
MDSLNHTAVVTTVLTAVASPKTQLSNILQPFLQDLADIRITSLLSEIFRTVLTFSVLWKTLVLIFLFSNIKGLPLIWHVRIPTIC